MVRWVMLGSAAVVVAACGTNVRPCSTSSDCAPAQLCIQGQCRGVVDVDGGSGAGTGGGGGSTVVTGCSPTATDNSTRDTDCDGLSDSEEYATDFGGGQHTDPCNADTDGDGLKDGLEVGKTASVGATCTFSPDLDVPSKTSPIQRDTDGDGLADGAEDANANGRIDPDEASPLRVDSDCDGYSDKEERDGAPGCVTNPAKKDTDGDGLQDGVEGGRVPPGSDPMGCTYTALTFDADTAVKTNACGADTDNDGVMDGAEDTNLNGKLDPGELDPTAMADAMGPAMQACSTANLKPVTFHSAGVPDVQLALPPGFAQVGRLTDSSGERGFVFYDPTLKVAALALSKTPQGADAVQEELQGRTHVGMVTAPIVQTFTTWDGFAGSVRATYDVGGTGDVVTRINDIAKAYLGNSVTGLLSGTGGTNGPFVVQAEYVRRTATRAVVVIALIPAALNTGQALFTVTDTGGGTALAQFGDFVGTQCEVFDATINAKVDFLWVVDDSGSMQSSQTAVGNAGTAFGAKLTSAGLDWRVGGVSTGFYTDGARKRNFTSDINVMRAWFTAGSPTTWGTGGSSTECVFSSVQPYVQNTLLPRTSNAAANQIRTGAQLHVIALTDTKDQSTPHTVTSFTSFLNNFDAQGAKAVLHGVICPEGINCGDSLVETPGRIHSVIRNTGGVVGDIRVANQNTPQAQQQLSNTIDAILSAAIGGTGHALQRPPISSTIKVAVASTRGASCTASDVPRSRTNGWDIDSATRRIVFYGDCIPSAAGVKVAVSYRYWNDASPDANGDACGAMCVAPLVCDPGTRSCVCPSNCGGCSQGLSCNTTTCACEPTIN